jgi:hypothetical protein
MVRYYGYYSNVSRGNRIDYPDPQFPFQCYIERRLQSLILQEKLQDQGWRWF